MKVRIEHIDEGFSAGYVTHSFNDIAGFSYNILPLKFNLLQKGNSKPNDKGVFKHYVGDYVKGTCEYDDKEHKGIIRHLYYSPENGKVKLVYVQDMNTQLIVPLQADTVKSIKWQSDQPKVMNYFFKNQLDMRRRN